MLTLHTNLCCKYKKISSAKRAKESSFAQNKAYFTVIILFLLIFACFIILAYSNSKTIKSINDDDNAEKITKNAELNIKLNKEENLENVPSIGHMLSCPTCCDPMINFDEWLESSPPNTNYKLLQTHYLTRHGGRTQCWKYPCWNKPSLPWNCNTKYGLETIKLEQDLMYGFQIYAINSTQVIPGNCLVGQLTPRGYNALYKHGRKLIHRYSKYYNLIPEKLDASNILDTIKNKIKLRADYVKRVQKSLMAIFSGMYPSNNNKFDESLNINIPIYIEDKNYEIITIASSNVCPYLAELREERINSDLFVDVSMDLMYELNETAQELLNNEIASYVDLFDCGASYLCFDKPVPLNLTQELFDAAQATYTWQFFYQGIYPDYITATKYHIGPLLKLIYFRFKYMIQKHRGMDIKYNISSLYMYGGHDTGPIAPLLSAFEYDLNNTWVPYAGTVTLELFVKNDDMSYWILISYNGVVLTIPHCQNKLNDYYLCEWNVFEQWMLSVVPNGIDECPNMKLTEYLSQNT